MKTLLTGLLLCVSTLLLHAQSTITGKITNEKGMPIQGVSIFIKGAKTGTLSDVNGFYSIKVPNDHTILVFAYVGCTPQEISVKGKTVIHVTLKPVTIALNEVIVIGDRSEERRVG